MLYLFLYLGIYYICNIYAISIPKYNHLENTLICIYMLCEYMTYMLHLYTYNIIMTTYDLRYICI